MLIEIRIPAGCDKALMVRDAIKAIFPSIVVEVKAEASPRTVKAPIDLPRDPGQAGAAIVDRIMERARDSAATPEACADAGNRIAAWVRGDKIPDRVLGGAAEAERRDMVEQVNENRAAKGLEPVKVDQLHRDPLTPDEREALRALQEWQAARDMRRQAAQGDNTDALMRAMDIEADALKVLETVLETVKAKAQQPASDPLDIPSFLARPLSRFSTDQT
jgi:hypothetical protein